MLFILIHLTVSYLATPLHLPDFAAFNLTLSFWEVMGLNNLHVSDGRGMTSVWTNVNMRPKHPIAKYSLRHPKMSKQSREWFTNIQTHYWKCINGTELIGKILTPCVFLFPFQVGQMIHLYETEIHLAVVFSCKTIYTQISWVSIPLTVCLWCSV